MIALSRMNLACLITNRNSFVCKSPVYFAPFPQFFCKQFATNTRVYDVLVRKHDFSPQVASLVSSHLTRFRSPKKVDSMLSFLEDSGFSSNQLEKIVKYDPGILYYNVEIIRFKIKIFQDLGLSSKDIAKMITSHQVILHSSAKNKIVPSLSMLNALLGSDFEVARLLRKSARLLSADLNTTLVPNVELLKSSGVPTERVLFLLYSYPRCFLINPDLFRECLDRAIEMGFSQSSKMFIYALRIIASMSKNAWDVKFQAFLDLGFSDSDVLAMFRKAPGMFSLSIVKVRKVKELLLSTGKIDISCIVNNPAALGCSIEKRYKPRLRILGILERRNLIEKWPSLAKISTFTDDQFSGKFIKPYSNELGDVYVSETCVEKR